MFAQSQDTRITLNCKVEYQENHDLHENHYTLAGTFQCHIGTSFGVHELDQIEAEIEKIGQEFKRQATQHVLEAADRRVAEVARVANPELHKHGTRPFTIVARYGDVTFQRQRLFNPTKKEKTTLIPSAIAWHTSKRRHLTAGLLDAACKESQQVSYRKASQNLADTSGQESLIAASTVWNKKQQRGKELKAKQKQIVDKIVKQHETVLVEHNIIPPSTTTSTTASTTATAAAATTTTTPSSEEVEADFVVLTSEQEDEVEALFELFTQQKRESQENVSLPIQKCDIGLTLENTVSEVSTPEMALEKSDDVVDDVILVQLDEVVTKSQEKDRKTNLTYTGTVEDRSGQVVYLVAESSEALIRLMAAQLVLFGLFAGRRLEVLGDGARWIATWAMGIVGVDVVTILCWWHLCKRVYEGLSGLGLAKEERKKWEREILGCLWRGEHALAIWKLWGLRSSARNAKRIDDLIGYLLRKKRQLVNYEVRHARGEWIASTRVEKWNDVAVSERCKHRGMSWTEAGVLAVAAYAENSKQKSNHTPTFHTIS